MTYFGLKGLNTLNVHAKAKEQDGGRGWGMETVPFVKNLGCVNISQELESKLIVGPYTEHREVLF